MSTNQHLNLLIEKAGLIVGSENKLAKLLGIPQQHISMWKSGIRTCAPADRARLAGFAKEDAVLELVKATLEHTMGTLRGDQLKRVLGQNLQIKGRKSTISLGMASMLCGTEKRYFFVQGNRSVQSQYLSLKSPKRLDTTTSPSAHSKASAMASGSVQPCNRICSGLGTTNPLERL